MARLTGGVPFSNQNITRDFQKNLTTALFWAITYSFYPLVAKNNQAIWNKPTFITY
jgi:hypothetical protein